jgi:hypothetical protein
MWEIFFQYPQEIDMWCLQIGYTTISSFHILSCNSRPSSNYVMYKRYIIYYTIQFNSPCGGGIEYLHRDTASRRRRRKGKSQIGDSKIWSQVPRDSDPRKTALARTSSTYKRHTRPLVREGAPQEQDGNCHTSNKYLVMGPRWGSIPRLTD